MLERGANQRWTLYPPTDPYADGYVAHVRTELRDDGLCAETTVTIGGPAMSSDEDLVAFLAGLADEWRGWPGSRRWRALEHQMSLAAAHDGRGHVSLEVTLRRQRRPYAEDAWSARSVVIVEAGEEMTALARDVKSLFAQPTE